MCTHSRKIEVILMPKNVCNLLKTVLICLLALVMSPVHSPQSPSNKEALTLLSIPKPNQSNHPLITNQNYKTHAEDISLTTNLFPDQLNTTKSSMLQKQYAGAQIFSLS